MVEKKNRTQRERERERNVEKEDEKGGERFYVSSMSQTVSLLTDIKLEKGILLPLPHSGFFEK